MGLIKAGIGALGGTMADQWKEVFVCDELKDDVLAVRALPRTDRRSSNTKGSKNVISDGSLITVSVGQCALTVENGRVVDVAMEPGQYQFSTQVEPSIFAPEASHRIKQVFSQAGNRFGFGGQSSNDQRVIYINTKEIRGGKFGTPSPIPFRIIDPRINLDYEASIRCNGEYSFIIEDPMTFYQRVIGNLDGEFRFRDVESIMRSSMVDALSPAFGEIAAKGIRYSEITRRENRDLLKQALSQELSHEWLAQRGISLYSVAINSTVMSEEDQEYLKQLQRSASLSNPNLAAGYSVETQGRAMNTAAGNPNGAMNGFIGMNMAGGGGNGGMAQGLFNVAAQGGGQPIPPVQQQGGGQQQQQYAQQGQGGQRAGGWQCPKCGNACSDDAAFCMRCGTPRPQRPAGAFCPKCGAPAQDGAAFCMKCGTKLA